MAINNLDGIEMNYLGQIVYNVFVKAFGDNVFFKNLDECNEVASEILKITKINCSS